MSRKSVLESSASALAQADVGASGIHPSVIASALGDSASTEALDRLNRAAQETKNVENAKALARAIQAVQLQDYAKADKLALKLLEKDERLGLAWHILAIAREKTGDFASSLRAYEAALTLLPDHGPVAGDLGRLAFRMNMPELAAKFFAHYRISRPDDVEGANNLACAQVGDVAGGRPVSRMSVSIDNATPTIVDWGYAWDVNRELPEPEVERDAQGLYTVTFPATGLDEAENEVPIALKWAEAHAQRGAGSWLRACAASWGLRLRRDAPNCQTRKSAWRSLRRLGRSRHRAP